MRIGWVPVLLQVGLAASAAWAQTATVLEIGGKQVPLAEGPWVAAGDAAGRLDPAATLGGFGMIHNLVLLRPTMGGRGVAAMAEVNANEIGIEDGWGLPADCEPDAARESATLLRGGWDVACWFVTARDWDWTADMPPAWRQAQAAAAQHGLALPHRTVTVGLRVANRMDVIDLRFHLAEGREPPQQEALVEWAVASLGLLEAGLKHGLPAGRALPAFDLGPAALTRAGIVRYRLARLEALVAEGKLTVAEARAQKAAIRDAAARDAAWTLDPATVDGLRWVTEQSGLALSDAVITYVWTARSVQAAALTALQTGLRSARTYLTGWVWSEVSPPATREDTARVVDFAYGGARAVE
jgi:hypothetical protein